MATTTVRRGIAQTDDHVYCATEDLQEATLAQVTKILEGADRSILLLTTACARKAQILVAEGRIVVEPECLIGGCVTAYIARLELSRNKLTPTEYATVIPGAKECCDTGCICNPDHNERPETHESIVGLTFSTGYFPHPLSGSSD